MLYPKKPSLGQYLRKSLGEFKNIYFLTIAIICIGLGTLLLMLNSAHSTDLYAYTFLLYAIPIVIYILSALFKDMVEAGKFMKEFAQFNGFAYADSAELPKNYPFFAFSGGEQQLFNIVTGTYDNHSFRLYTFLSSIITGRRDIRAESRTVFERVLANQSPDILILSKKFQANKDSASELSSRNNVKVDLEGNFDTFFSVFVPKGYETESLEILTPDIMAFLIDHAQGINIEYSGSYLFISAQKVTDSPQIIDSIFKTAHALAAVSIPETQDSRAPVLSVVQPNSLREWLGAALAGIIIVICAGILIYILGGFVR